MAEVAKVAEFLPFLPKLPHQKIRKEKNYGTLCSTSRFGWIYRCNYTKDPLTNHAIAVRQREVFGMRDQEDAQGDRGRIMRKEIIVRQVPLDRGYRHPSHRCPLPIAYMLRLVRDDFDTYLPVRKADQRDSAQFMDHDLLSLLIR